MSHNIEFYDEMNDSYALVICNHSPHQSPGIAWTDFSSSKPLLIKSSALRGHLFGKNPDNFPRSLLCFHCTDVFANTMQTLGISPTLWGQIEGNPPPPTSFLWLFPTLTHDWRGGGRAVITNDMCIMIQLQHRIL